jgi:hypothetical membrane protein
MVRPGRDLAEATIAGAGEPAEAVMDERTRSRDAQAAAIVGVIALGVGSLVTALAYTGTGGERYSPLNHWVSELGQTSVSQAAPFFNICLIVGGTCFAAFMAILAMSIPGRLRYAWGAIGVVAGVSGALVGVFPMDQLTVHSIVALSFFVLGSLSVAIASIDLARRPDQRFPRWLAVIGAVVTVCFVLFMVALFTDPTSGRDVLAAPDARPDVWVAAILEWSVVIGVLVWTLATALAWLRADRADRAARTVAAA